MAASRAPPARRGAAARARPGARPDRGPLRLAAAGGRGRPARRVVAAVAADDLRAPSRKGPSGPCPPPSARPSPPTTSTPAPRGRAPSTADRDSSRTSRPAGSASPRVRSRSACAPPQPASAARPPPSRPPPHTWPPTASTYDRPGAQEWYANGPFGLEQGFTVARPAASQAGQGTYTVTMALSGNAKPTLVGWLARAAFAVGRNGALRRPARRGRRQAAAAVVALAPRQHAVPARAHFRRPFPGLDRPAPDRRRQSDRTRGGERGSARKTRLRRERRALRRRRHRAGRSSRRRIAHRCGLDLPPRRGRLVTAGPKAHGLEAGAKKGPAKAKKRPKKKNRSAARSAPASPSTAKATPP